MMIFTEWLADQKHEQNHFPKLREEYEEGDILHFWYLCNEKSPAVKKFVAGLSDLLEKCFPSNKKYTDTKESELSPLIHRYIRVANEDAV